MRCGPCSSASPTSRPPHSSLLPLPHRYVVPGGRFREIYYWDSYFTMLGLEESGRHDLVADMVKNFAWLIDHYGHIPNGNRTYYLSRSQPPFFAAMVELLAEREGVAALSPNSCRALSREYEFWMDGAEGARPGRRTGASCGCADGTMLNRYWDDRDTPREESYREDVETASASGRPAAEVYRNLRAAAESGWDFSSRWLADGKDARDDPHRRDRCRSTSTACCTTLEHDPRRGLPHDRQTPRRWWRIDRRARASAAGAIHRHLWNPEAGVFDDYLWKRAAPHAAHLSAATLYPLFFGIANAAQASDVAAAVERRLLRARRPRDDDRPHRANNGTLRMAGRRCSGSPSEGSNRYGYGELPARSRERWIGENIAVYRATGKLVEKYDVSGDDAARGGEYPLQDGFGWTNGVLRRLLALNP